MLTYILFIALAGACFELELHNVDNPVVAHGDAWRFTYGQSKEGNDENRGKDRNETPGRLRCHESPIRMLLMKT